MGIGGGKAQIWENRLSEGGTEEKSKAHPQLGARNIVLTVVFTSVIVGHGFRVGRDKKPSESR